MTPADRAVLARMTLGAGLLVIVQIALGMVVNLYVTVPRHHPGARPGNYFAGSFASVVWAIGHGGLSLAVHGALGLALVVMALSVAFRAVKIRAARLASVLAALFVLGAGFNGASFLDFSGQNISSLLMALLALAALSCYFVALHQLRSAPTEADGDRPTA